MCWRYVFLVILRQLLQKRPGGIFVFAVMVVWISKEVRFVICSCPSLLTCSTIYFCAYLPSWFFFKCMFGASLTKSTSMVFQCVRKWWKEKKIILRKKECFCFLSEWQVSKNSHVKCNQVRFYDVMPDACFKGFIWKN